MPYLSIKNVSKVYPNGVRAVSNFNLDVEKHDFVVILGPSGCGKSTMLRMISGLESITSGEMILDDKVINTLSPKDRDIAMVFQNYALYGHMTTYDNIGFSLLVRKKNRRTIHQKVVDAAGIVKITSEQLKRKPTQLSGGQRQRVALGRTIARDAKVFLMDEPLSNLDAKLRGGMRLEIINLYEKYNQTIIYVSHDQVEAMTMATKIVLMNDGIIQQIASPNYIYNHPSNLFVATFLGSPQMNLINGKLNKGMFSNEHFSLYLPAYSKITNDNVVLGIRSENLIISEDADFTLLVDYIEFFGSKSIVHGLLGTTCITVNAKNIIDVSTIDVKINVDKVVIFDNKTTDAIRSELYE